MRMNILLWTAIVLATSCSTDNGLLKEKEPDMPPTSIPDTSASEDKTTTNSPFTAQTTVGEVINDAAFSDFGRLLFPVDRSVPTTMTLAPGQHLFRLYLLYEHKGGKDGRDTQLPA